MDTKKTFFNEIRIICCLVVIYEHCVVLTNSNYICLGLRSTCVNVFFILSGFWVTKSYLKCNTLKEYVLKRFRRIVPLYIGVVLFCAIFFSVFSSFSLKLYLTSDELIKYLIANLLGMNFIYPTLPGVFNGAVINGSLWTIKIEVGFYILLPIIVYVFKRIKESNRKYWIVLIYLLSIVWSVVMPFFIEQYHLPEGLLNQIPKYLVYFTMGMCFELFQGKTSQKLLHSKFCFSYALVILAVNFFFNSAITFWVEPIALAILVFYIAYHVPALCKEKEELSYGMYLFHFPIIQLFKWLGFFDRYSFVAILAVFGTSYMIISVINFISACFRNLHMERCS